MFFSGRRALLGTEWNSYFLVSGNLEFPLVCFRVFCVPGVFQDSWVTLRRSLLGFRKFSFLSAPFSIELLYFNLSRRIRWHLGSRFLTTLVSPFLAII